MSKKPVSREEFIRLILEAPTRTNALFDALSKYVAEHPTVNDLSKGPITIAAPALIRLFVQFCRAENMPEEVYISLVHSAWHAQDKPESTEDVVDRLRAKAEKLTKPQAKEEPATQEDYEDLLSTLHKDDKTTVH